MDAILRLISATIRLRTIIFCVVFLSQGSSCDYAQELLLKAGDLKRDEPQAKEVAIIGAGSAGASVAYFLRQNSDAHSIPVNITVFEQSSYVGGRSTTINAFEDPAFPIELGASIFVEANTNLMKAAKQFGLDTREAGSKQPNEAMHSLGVWDGTEFVFLQKAGSYTWWSAFKLLWKYGLAPIRTQNLMRKTVHKFLRLYKWPYFPWKSLSEVALDVGLVDAASTTGAEFLKEHGIAGPFVREIIQASTRVNYGQNLPLIHGLETIVCMATDGAVSVEGGNWQIFQGMLNASRAKVLRNTRVTHLQRDEDGPEVFLLRHAPISNIKSGTVEEFDEVVVAAPFQFSQLHIHPALEHHPDVIPYVRLQVTIVSSPYKLSPKRFNLSPESTVPEVVLTTLPEGLDLGARRDGVGPAGFWSISTLQKAVPPNGYHPNVTAGDHYLYKVFSPKQLNASFICALFDEIEDWQDFCREEATIGDVPKAHISWYHEKFWPSYPYLYPRITFENTKLAPQLWYTNGIESFISTMETSSLAGMNVAELMVMEWLETANAPDDE